MSAFTEHELEYLGARKPERLGRIATVGRDGTPHVMPVGWRYKSELDTIDVGGMELPATKKFRDARRTGRAATVIDDLASSAWGLESKALGERNSRTVSAVNRG